MLAIAMSTIYIGFTLDTAVYVRGSRLNIGTRDNGFIRRDGQT